MPDASDPPALGRIERALARIEAASAQRLKTADSLARRHAALRARMEDAVTALDELIAREERRAEDA